jgi:predicted peptidase
VAAVIPVCGGGDEDKAMLMKNIPVWAFHGDKDPLVKPFRSANMVNAIKEAGGTARLTMYKNTGHDSWTKTYNNPEVLKWMFAQKCRTCR